MSLILLMQGHVSTCLLVELFVVNYYTRGSNRDYSDLFYFYSIPLYTVVWDKLKYAKTNDRWQSSTEVCVDFFFILKTILMSSCIIVLLHFICTNNCVICLIQEEFEDSKGNVMSRKMYDDLRRQGIL